MDPPRLRDDELDFVPWFFGQHPLVESVERWQREEAAHRVGDGVGETSEVVASLIFFMFFESKETEKREEERE